MKNGCKYPYFFKATQYLKRKVVKLTNYFYMIGKLRFTLFCFMVLLLNLNGQECASVKDYDGNIYATVQLGTQCWMAENLRVTHFADGTPLQLGNLTDGQQRFYYYPNQAQANVAQYGLLYSWYTIMNGHPTSEEVPSGVQGICPDGWHLPSNFEWMGLEDYLGYKEAYRCGTDVNNVAKALASKEGWHSDFMTSGQPCCIVENAKTNNSSGMNVLPAGNFFNTSDGFGVDAGFWTASDGSDVSAPIHHFYYTNAVIEINCTPKEAAYSVRCVKN